MKIFVGVDIGTTGIRAGVYDEEFHLLGSGSGRSIIRRGSDNEIIQDPEEMYIETAHAVRNALKESRVDKRDIVCLSFDGQMAGVMGIDKNWRAVTPYDSWLDTRCSDQVALIKSKGQRKVIEKSGNTPSYNHGPKILWWKKNKPDVFSEIKSFIQPSGYVAGKLCGLSGKDAYIDWTYIHFSGFADITQLRWDDELTSLFKVPIEKLPKIVSPFSIIGTVTKDGGELFGIRKDVPVAAGCGDTTSCFLGTGALEKGIAVDVAGTASVLALVIDNYITDYEGLVYSARSVFEDEWYSLSYINGGGQNLEWFRNTFASQRTFEELDNSIEIIVPGSEGLMFIPHLEGRGYPNNPNMRGQWKGFTRDHEFGHFYRSILEGIAYEYALYMEKILSLSENDAIYNVRGVAGGSKSGAWNQIKADVLNCNYCTINREDISILGQAIIAARAVGHIKNVKETVKAIIKEENIFYPDKTRHEIYCGCIKEYQKLLAMYDS